MPLFVYNFASNLTLFSCFVKVVKAKNGSHNSASDKKMALQRNFFTGRLGPVKAAKLILRNVVEIPSILKVINKITKLVIVIILEGKAVNFTKRLRPGSGSLNAMDVLLSR